MSFNNSAYFVNCTTTGDPQHYFKFEGGSTSLNGGTLYASVASATLTGTPDYANGWVDKTDTALKTYSGNSRVTVASAITTSDFSTKLTYELWVKPSYGKDDKIPGKEVLMYQTSATNGQTKLQMVLNEVNAIEVWHTDSSGNLRYLLSSKTQLMADTWYHTALVVNGDLYTLVINGNTDNEIKTFAFSVSETISLNFCGYSSYPTGWTYFSGQVDELAIYASALTEAQLDNHFQFAGVLNIDAIVEKESFNIQTRVRVSTVDWGYRFGSVNYGKSVVSSNPMVYCKFDKNSSLSAFNYGTTGNTNLGTYTTCGPDATFTDTIDDTACEFTGTGDVDFGNIVYTTDTPFTMEVWVYPVDNTQRVVVSNSAVGNRNIVLKLTASGAKVKANLEYAYAVSSYTTVVSTNELELNQWTLITVRVDGTTAKLYLNGIEDTSTSTSNKLYYGATYSCKLGGSNYTLAGTSGYSGYLDEFAFYDYAMSDSAIYEHYNLGYNGLTYNPIYDLDVAPIVDKSQSQGDNYLQAIRLSEMLHYWAVSDAVSVVNYVDEGLATDLVTLDNSWSGDSPDTTTVKGFARSRTFNSVTTYATTAGAHKHLDLATPATRTPVTIEFWANNTDNYTSGFVSPKRLLAGFSNGAITVNTQGGKCIVGILQNDSSIYYTPPVTIDDWGRLVHEFVYYVVTVDAVGKIHIWRNGALIGSFTNPDNAGIIAPPTTASLKVCTTATGITKGASAKINALAVTNKVVSDSEIQNRYLLGTYGIGFSKRKFTSENVQSGTYAVSKQRYATLRDEVDISKYVQSFSIDKQVDRLVDGCLMVFKDTLDNPYLKSVIDTNKYVIIEEKYFTADGALDSGWVPQGHFLVDGPVADQNNPTATSNMVKMSSLLKLATLNNFAGAIEPDKLFVAKTNTVFYSEDSTSYTFKIKRNPLPLAALVDNDNYYYNWAEAPSAKLYVSQFTVAYAGANAQYLGQDITTGAIGEEFQVRASNGSIQVLGGEGSIVINKNWFNTSVPEGGLGGPDNGTTTGSVAPGVKAEIYRYATMVDTYGGLLNGVTSIATMTLVDRKFSLTFNQTVPDMENKTMFLKSGKAKGEYYKLRVCPSDATKVYVTDINGRVVNPYLEGIKVGDLVQVGDCNLIDDAIRKYLVINSFQENDPSKPFYYKVDRSLQDALVKPIKISLLENVGGADVYKELENYMAPNYYLSTDKYGVTRTRTVIVNSVAKEAHTITYNSEEATEATDLAISTRVIAQGRGKQSIDLGTHITSGGTLAVKAYKLTNFGVNGPSDHASNTGAGYTLSQADADSVIAQVFDGNGKTPYTTQNGFDLPGLLYRQYGSSIRRIDMSTTDLFVADVGLNTTTESLNQYEVDAIDMSFFSSFRDGAQISQSMEVYYMTDQDYFNELNLAAPKVPSQTDNTYMPASTAKSWKLLIEDTNLREGNNIITSEQFEGGQPVKLRFLKFRVGQPNFRLSIPGKDANRHSVVSLSGVRIWTSNRIIATAGLGVTPPFSTGTYKELATKYNERTAVLDINPYLDTYSTALGFAISELRERQQEFRPKSVVVTNPQIHAGDIVGYTPVADYLTTNTARKYLVYSSTYSSDGRSTNIVLMNYDIDL